MFTHIETLPTFVGALIYFHRMIKRFETKLMEEAFDFVKKQDQKTRNKILQNMRRAEISSDPALFKKLTSTVWEFRTIYKGLQYRLFAFRDKEDHNQTLVFATHGVIKKTWKVNNSKLIKTDHIRKEYSKQTENENA